MSVVVSYGNLADGPGFFVCAIRDWFKDEMVQSQVLEFETYSTLKEARTWAVLAVEKYAAHGPHEVTNP